MRPREIVGYQIREERTRRGWTQAALGEVVSSLTGTKWFGQTVAAAEKGERAFTVDDLIALSIALTLTLEQLTTAPPGETMDLGQASDATATPATVRAAAAVPSPTVEERLVADVDRAVQALKNYVTVVTVDKPGAVTFAGSEVTLSAKKASKAKTSRVAKKRRK